MNSVKKMRNITAIDVSIQVTLKEAVAIDRKDGKCGLSLIVWLRKPAGLVEFQLPIINKLH